MSRATDPRALRQGKSLGLGQPEPSGAVVAGGEQGAVAVTGSATSLSDVSPWGWAVAEIRRDGSWGTPRLVPARSSVRMPHAPGTGDTLRDGDVSCLLHARDGSRHAAEGRFHLAAATFARGSRTASPVAGAAECLGRLAHVLALQGELARAVLVASRVPCGPVTTGPAQAHARVALAWAALLRGDLTHAGHLLGAPGLTDVGGDPWLAASGTVARSALRVASGDPDTATRLLVADAEVAGGVERPGWWLDELTVSRAEALLASGEVQRSLALLTPLPTHAHAAAAVQAATARHAIGDLRGAHSVLGQAEEELDGAPVAVQMRAWLLAARLAEERGEHETADLGLDRVLRTATSTGVLLPLLRHRGWIRHCLDRSPGLMHTHRSLLARCDASDHSGHSVPRPRTLAPTPDGAPTAALTEREEQVLELLAQMFSTEEIAGALYISTNTVKTHLKGIFGKLCVNRRVDAVRRGRQLGLC